MKSATAVVSSERSENTDAAVERARKIEDSICSVITNVHLTSPTTEFSPTNQFISTPPRINSNNNASGALNEFSSSSVIPKHKSLASSLPSLTGVMVNTNLSSLSCNPSAAVASLNICRSNSSTTTTTSTRSSRHLQLVGDLPENVLETSCTPPSSPSKQHHQLSSSSTTPVFASLTPVSIGIDNVNTTPTTTTTNILGLISPTSGNIQDLNHHRLMTINSSSTGAIFTANNTATALTQLFPMGTGSTTVQPAYLAVKVEPQEVRFNSPTLGGGIDNSTTTCSSAILSPLQQYAMATGGGNLTSLAAVAGTSSGSSTNVGSNSDFLSLQPAAVYMQPLQQNGQMQYVRLELPGLGSGTSATNTKPSTVSTVELAHNIIATMFQQPVGGTSSNNVQPIFASNESLQTSMTTNRGRENEIQVATSNAMPPTFVLTEQMELKNDPGFKITTVDQPARPTNSIQQRTLPAGITVTAAPVAIQQQQQHQQPTPASVGARKRISSSSIGQSHPKQQSLSKDAPSSTENAGILSGEDDGDDIFIDTKDLCNRIAYELKAHSIPQAVFAERVLCRSQGTLSDLLRNPKPWNKLKSGRETFRRMYVWLKQPLVERLTTLELWKTEKRKSETGDEPMEGDVQFKEEGNVVAQIAEASGGESPEEISTEDCFSGGEFVSPRSDDPVPSTSNQQSSATVAGIINEQTSPQRHQQRLIKKPRLVFTDIQKRTLQAIFKETQRPSREMQQTIAEHLNLDLSTVQNFFMNARRRSRIEQPEGGGDSPTPFQQVRPITPPPIALASPPVSSNIDSAGRPRPTITPTILDTPTIKTKRANRKSTKQRQIISQTQIDESDNDHARSRLAFSGTTTSSTTHGISLPTLVLRDDHDEEDDEELLEEEDNEEEFIEEEEEENGGSSPDALSYGPGRAFGQGESTTTNSNAVESSQRL